MLEWRLADEDWKVFGGPEWLRLDWDQFATWSWGRLDELENDYTGMGMSIRRARLLLLDGRGRGIKAALWLARMTSGDPELHIGWDAFDVQRPLQASNRAVAAPGDADPPGGTSPADTAGETTPPPASSNGSPADDPSATSSPA